MSSYRLEQPFNVTTSLQRELAILKQQLQLLTKRIENIEGKPPQPGGFALAQRDADANEAWEKYCSTSIVSAVDCRQCGHNPAGKCPCTRRRFNENWDRAHPLPNAGFDLK